MQENGFQGYDDKWKVYEQPDVGRSARCFIPGRQKPHETKTSISVIFKSQISPRGGYGQERDKRLIKVQIKNKLRNLINGHWVPSKLNPMALKIPPITLISLVYEIIHKVDHFLLEKNQSKLRYPAPECSADTSCLSQTIEIPDINGHYRQLGIQIFEKNPVLCSQKW